MRRHSTGARRSQPAAGTSGGLSQHSARLEAHHTHSTSTVLISTTVVHFTQMARKSTKKHWLRLFLPERCTHGSPYEPKPARQQYFSHISWSGSNRTQWGPCVETRGYTYPRGDRSPGLSGAGHNSVLPHSAGSIALSPVRREDAMSATFLRFASPFE